MISEDEGIDVSIPVKYPQLSVEKIVRRIRRFDKRGKGTYRPRHYHTKQFPCAKKEAMLAEIGRRKRLAQEDRKNELPSKWDIPSRVAAKQNYANTVVWLMKRNRLMRV